MIKTNILASLIVASGISGCASLNDALVKPTSIIHHTTSNNDSNFFNTAYRSDKVAFPNLYNQFKHEQKYQVPNWSGPKFDTYWGRDYPYPFNAQQVMKDTGIKNFTLAFLNSLYDEDETHNLAAGYVDSIQEIHALGGHVTISIGGGMSQEPASFFNGDPSAAVMYKHLLDTALAYNVDSFDFDIEGTTTLYGNDVKALGLALAKLKTTLASYGKVLHLRFTLGTVDAGLLANLTKYLGSDFIWNDMSWTGGGASSLVDITSTLTDDEETMHSNPAFAKMTVPEVFHHLGMTAAVIFNNIPYKLFQQLLPWVNQHQLGLVSIWKVNDDHINNSPLDPTEGTSAHFKDFQYTDLINNQFGIKATWNKPAPVKPAQPAGLRVYAKSKQYISLKWNAVPHALYYIIKSGNQTIVQTTNCFGALSFREYPKMAVVGSHTFTVTAVNQAGASLASKPITVNIAKNTISGQIEYWDANINYNNVLFPNKQYAPEVKYIDYNHNVYQDLNTTATGVPMGLGTPAKNKKDWKLLGPDTNPSFGLSTQRRTDLANFQWNTYVKSADPLTFVQFNQGDDTSKMLPYINDFVVATPHKAFWMESNPLIANKF